jgi:hypothetical protein
MVKIALNYGVLKYFYLDIVLMNLKLRCCGHSIDKYGAHTWVKKITRTVADPKENIWSNFTHLFSKLDEVNKGTTALSQNTQSSIGLTPGPTVIKLYVCDLCTFVISNRIFTGRPYQPNPMFSG